MPRASRQIPFPDTERLQQLNAACSYPTGLRRQRQIRMFCPQGYKRFGQYAYITEVHQDSPPVFVNTKISDVDIGLGEQEAFILTPTGGTESKPYAFIRYTSSIPTRLSKMEGFELLKELMADPPGSPPQVPWVAPPRDGGSFPSYSPTIICTVTSIHAGCHDTTDTFRSPFFFFP